MTRQHNQCNELPLEQLLAEGDASDDLHALTDHVEGCEKCQSRLTALAADPSWWKDANQLLSVGSDIDWRPDATWSSHVTSSGPVRPEPSEATVRKLLSPPRHPELLGRLGRYDIERVIGSGGMGVVLKAHDSELNRPVAIKLLAAHLAHVGASRERFAREGRAAAAVVHEHVVAIHNVESDGAVPFLVMQYVPGQSLQSRVDESGPLAVEQILRIGMQAAAGLAAAHAQGLVHRDVKPSNILLEETVERAVLTDFGLARTIDDASLTRTGVLAGTPHYMSPEQAMGQAIDHRSDLFSLGAVLYFMATGHPPFRADGALAVLHRICRDRQRPVWQSNTEIPDELSDLIDQLLEKKPSRRPATAAEVSQRLAAQLSRVQQYGIGRRRFGGLRRRWQRRITTGATLVTILGALAFTAAYYRTSAPSPAEDTPPPTVSTSVDLSQAVREFAGQDRTFSDELSAVRSAIDRSSEPAAFPPTTEDAWQKEAEALKRELSKLESEQGIVPNKQGGEHE